MTENLKDPLGALLGTSPEHPNRLFFHSSGSHAANIHSEPSQSGRRVNCGSCTKCLFNGFSLKYLVTGYNQVPSPLGQDHHQSDLAKLDGF